MTPPNGLIGQTIDGEYRVLGQIGEGGFGQVYRCEEIALKRIVAVKLLHLEQLSESQCRAFMDEARTLASINHANVVQIYRLGASMEKPYIVMEYLEGETLRDLLLGPRPSLRRIVEIMQQAAAGLEAIHGAGVVHRDVSPNNIMQTRSGAVKILDFGLARKLDALTTINRSASLVGTAPYIAPEQVEGGKSSPVSDIFSFGVILYELVAGRHPFQAEHPMSILYNVVNREPEAIAGVASECPEALADLIGRCLQKNPAHRPATLQVVERALLDMLASPDLAASAETPPAARHAAAVHRNPFLNRVMIKRRDDFFGRRQEIKRICARLTATPPGSISVVGERKIGKSSLLNHVYMPSNRAHLLPRPDKLIMLFIDLQEQKGMSVESFVKMVLGMASYELRGRLDVSDCAPTLDGIKEMIQRIDRAGFHLALFLDEFEAITANPNFNLEFFSFLRFLANHYNVAYVTSSASDLQSFCHAEEISDSPFFNIFSTLNLTTLTPEEARELVTKPSSAAGKPLEPWFDEILDMAGLFPFFLQIACSHALEYMEDHPLGENLEVAEVRQRFYDEARLHYRYIWDNFDRHERNVVQRIARRKNVPAALAHVVADLGRRGYVVVESGRPRLFSSCFLEFAKTEATQKESRSWLERLLPPRAGTAGRAGAVGKA
jgi:serine/threonine protein kinase